MKFKKTIMMAATFILFSIFTSYGASAMTEDISETAIPESADESVSADSRVMRNINLGTSVITDPKSPEDVEVKLKGQSFHDIQVWYGTYVYFGGYEYRVLDADTTDYSESNPGVHTMLLNSNNILWTQRFNGELSGWEESEVKDFLNNQFMEEAFTPVERLAIVASSKETANRKDIGNLMYVPLHGEKVFLLDADEVVNEAYGYSSDEGKNLSRHRFGDINSWWLRSREVNLDGNAGYVENDGKISYASVTNEMGVCPAFNLDISRVLFTSDGTSPLLKATENVSPEAWKLTLLDCNQTIEITEGSYVERDRKGKITIPYTYTNTDSNLGTGANSLSVMITDDSYTEADARINYYGRVSKLDGISSDGSVEVTLPESWSGSGKIYLIAEQINEDYITNYAAIPLELQLPELESQTIPSAFIITCGACFLLILAVMVIAIIGFKRRQKGRK